MEFVFNNKRISGLLTVFPEKLSSFEDEVIDVNDPKSRRLKKIIGFGTRYRAKETTTMSDLFLFGLKKLIAENKVKKEEIGAIVVVTLCPDFFLPQISSIIHGELELDENVFCMDIPQACAGYVVGLIESFLLLDHLGNKKVILCTGEIFNRISRKEQKTTSPSFGGDVANISVVENCDKDYNKAIYADIKNDGGNRENLIIRYGAFKDPMTAELINGKKNALPCTGIEMDGSSVFNFVQKEVPPMIKAISEKSGHSFSDFDYFLFHQPNKFMLQKLATALGVPYDKIPMDITEKYGNSDSGTIPVVMTQDVSENLLSKDNLCCLSGFGGGLTWCAIVMNIGHMEFCESVVSGL